MVIGERLRELREEKNLSQGDIEHKTGLLRCYISRVENGHTTPAIETLEKLARAMDVPLYQLFTEKLLPAGTVSITGGKTPFDRQIQLIAAKMSGPRKRALLKIARVLATAA